MLRAVHHRHPRFGLQAYQDNVYLTGTDVEVGFVIDTFHSLWEDVQLHVNASKSCVLAPPSSSPWKAIFLGSCSRCWGALLLRLDPLLVQKTLWTYSLMRSTWATICFEQPQGRTARRSAVSIPFVDIPCREQVCAPFAHYAAYFAAEHDRHLWEFLKDVFDIPLVHCRRIQPQLHQFLRAAGVGSQSLDDDSRLG